MRMTKIILAVSCTFPGGVNEGVFDVSFSSALIQGRVCLSNIFYTLVTTVAFE